MSQSSSTTTTPATAEANLDLMDPFQTKDDSFNATFSSRRPFFRIYYNDVYQVDLPPRHRFPMSKYGQVRRLVQRWIETDLSQEERDKVECEFQVSPLATVEELRTTHSEDYIQRYLTGNQTEQEQRNVGFPWSLQGVNRSLSSVGGTLAAACDVCNRWKQRLQQPKEQQTNANENTTSYRNKIDSIDTTNPLDLIPPWGAHIAGGTHHAFFDRGEGFSVFSDIAVAANVVLQRYPEFIRRVLIVDLDVHQGNGNAALFQNHPQVDTFSIQCEGNYFSPKQQSTLDIDLPIGCNDGTYLSTLNHWLNQILKRQHSQREDDQHSFVTNNDGSKQRHYYDLVFFQAGVDILEEDRLGRMSISEQGVQRRNELVYEFARNMNCPFVICMGGGYPRGDDWTPILRAHASVYYQAHQCLARNARPQARGTPNSDM